MLVRKISIFFIIIIIIIELYLTFCVDLEVENNNFTNTELEKVKEIIIINKKPWDKIKETSGMNYYYIKIKDFDEVKFMEWKDIVDNLEYDINDKLLMIPSKDEERAVSIVNLMISNMKGDIDMKDILENNLINKSIIKSRKYNVIFNKILNLVIDNNSEDPVVKNNIDTFSINEINDDTKDVVDDINNNSICKNDINKNKPIGIKPEEYNYDGFNNSHNNLFKKDKLIRNNLSSGAYMGKQYARPFS